MPIKHAFTNPKSDGADATITRPSDWNADHVGVPNLWIMGKSGTLGDQTLTNNTDTQITFDTAEVDGGESCIDLANERFVLPTDGYYIATPHWAWLGTVPGSAWTVDARINGSSVLSLIRSNAVTGSTAANGTGHGSIPFEGVAGDLITMWVNPGAITGVVARGTSGTQTRTKISLVRLIAL